MRNRTWDYHLGDNGGSSLVEKQEILLPLGAIFRHEYGIYRVTNYLNAGGLEETRYSHITDVECERDYNLTRKLTPKNG
ncbi:hypothetical protein [Sphingobacterium sp. JUb56]|uniref:hypothetical protein n=1 Tax=Sphingobacterium sp. JUb56 TaxID=2587145 RepID=UPI00161D75A8|nr:hypothetical protein [Sphingobacterium sp. JUb56]MBB2951999.1 hypothetical protein [Sphingobacterium sp. JUb56]